MSLDNGRGDVESKNHPLVTPICEKLTAVKHCNGKDYWVITHEWNSDAFYAYLVTAAGVSSIPVVRHVGRVVTGDPRHTVGYMKVPPDNKRLAIGHSMMGVDLFRFNSSNGVVSDGMELLNFDGDYLEVPYGIEFSPNSRKLYVSLNYADFNDPNGMGIPAFKTAIWQRQFPTSLRRNRPCL